MTRFTLFRYFSSWIKRLGENSCTTYKQVICVFSVLRCMATIKSSVESLDQLGDRLTSDDVVAANDLVKSKIPDRWMQLGGDTCPPNHTPLIQWINDLSLRVGHFERILALVSELLYLDDMFHCIHRL